MKGLLVALTLAVSLATGFGRAAEGPADAVQQVWLLSTRCAPRCGNLEAGLAQITYHRLDASCPDGRWLPTDAAAFRQSGAADVPTVIAIHGNRTDPDWAVKFGSSFYMRLQQLSAGRPFRLVIWSWPSDRVSRRSRTDAQIKTGYSDTESYYLARTLASLPPGAPLSLIGYSLGSRVAGGGLVLLAGGQVAGRQLTADQIAPWTAGGARPIRVMFLAAAMDEDALEPCQADALATPAVQRILVTQNGVDRVLRWYTRLNGRHGPQALGYAGPAGPDGGKLEVVDVSCWVGKKHDWRLYGSAPAVEQRLGWYAFLE